MVCSDISTNIYCSKERTSWRRNVQFLQANVMSFWVTTSWETYYLPLWLAAVYIKSPYKEIMNLMFLKYTIFKLLIVLESGIIIYKQIKELLILGNAFGRYLYSLVILIKINLLKVQFFYFTFWIIIYIFLYWMGTF